ncbi:MAG: RsbRD N-terminal domain-containing protein [Desulfobulbaceae bacterium]|nr:RsbRD N-terminal domain-containing protein [Desulfobulbaceae bacterium]
MGNEFENLLNEKKKEILSAWEDTILGKFEKDAFIIFKQQKDQFANPIGHKVRTGLEELFNVLSESSNREVRTPNLEELIKLRAVQDISASNAVSFVFQLKDIVRKELQIKDMTNYYKDWLAFEARIDAAALAVFDMYMASREQLHKVRYTELQAGRDIITKGGCPSALMRQEQNKKA